MKKNLPVGKSETVGGEDGAIAVDEDRPDAQQLGDLAGVLTTGATERGQSTFFDHVNFILASQTRNKTKIEISGKEVGKHTYVSLWHSPSPPSGP